MQTQLLQTRQALGRAESSVPKRLFHMSWWRALFIPGQRVSLCPPTHPLCPTAALLSRGDLDEGGVVQPGRWQTHICPLCSS